MYLKLSQEGCISHECREYRWRKALQSGCLTVHILFTVRWIWGHMTMLERHLVNTSYSAVCMRCHGWSDSARYCCAKNVQKKKSTNCNQVAARWLTHWTASTSDKRMKPSATCTFCSMHDQVIHCEWGHHVGSQDRWTRCGTALNEQDGWTITQHSQMTVQTHDKH